MDQRIVDTSTALSGSTDHDRKILDRARTIPEGFVATYGDLCPEAPRRAGAVMASCEDKTVPGIASSAPMARSPSASASAPCSKPRASHSAAAGLTSASRGLPSSTNTTAAVIAT